MAHIRNIDYAHVGRNEGCLCDRCGQYIVNIIAVEFTDGMKINLGMDCFRKLQDTGKLTAYGKRLFSKAVKLAQGHRAEYNDYATGKMNADNDEEWKNYELPMNAGCYWAVHHEDYEAFRRWKIDEWYPQRFKEDEKRFAQFKNVNFKIEREIV